MAKITVLAGDFLKGEGQLALQSLVLPTERNPAGEAVPLAELARVEKASEETARDMVGTIGWGAAGTILLGPLGLLVGAYLGGRRHDITFVAHFKDGRRLLATADSATYNTLLAAVF